MDRAEGASNLPTKEEIDELYTKARRSLDKRAAPFIPGVGRVSFNSGDRSSYDGSADGNLNPTRGSSTDEIEPEVSYHRRLVVRTHRNVASLSAGPHSEAGSPASFTSRRSDGGSPASFAAALSEAGSPALLTVARNLAGSPASFPSARGEAGSPASLPSTTSLPDSTIDESKTEVRRKGKVVIRSHRNVGSLSAAPHSEAGSPASLKSGHSAAGSPASLAGVGSEGGSRTSLTAEQNVAGSSMSLAAGEGEPDFSTSLSATRTLAGLPAAAARGRASSPASLAAVRSLADSMADDSEAEVIRDGKVVIRSHHNVARLEPEAEMPPERQGGETEDPSMDVGPLPVVPVHPEEDSSCGRGTPDAAPEPPACQQTLSAGANSMDSGSSTKVHTDTAGVQLGPSETLDLRIFCGSWNVAGRRPDSVEEIGLWLDVDKLDAEGDTSDPPDLFVIGLQEVVELSAQNVVMDNFIDKQSKTVSLQWFAQVFAYLTQYGQRHGVKYVMVSEKQLLGTYILVMAKETVCDKIAHVQSALMPTGLGGYFGNKGAVAVRMEVGGGSSICFVCAHMTAGREHVLARNAEYKIISSRPVFADTAGRLLAAEEENVEKSKDKKDKGKEKGKKQGSTWGSLFGTVGQGGRSGGLSPTRNSQMKKAVRDAMSFTLPKGAEAGSGQRPTTETSGGNSDGMEIEGNETGGEKGASVNGQDEVDHLAFTPRDEIFSPGLPKTKTVLQADVVLWLGDLNYRISDEVSDQEVFDMLRKDDLETLRELDQLNIARVSGAAFQEFQEGPLCFPPSYKYIPGTKDFDNRPEKKVRCPAWCDRVLYYMGMHSGGSVRRLGLDRYWSSGPLLSDHMPVNALFRTSLACVPTKRVAEPEMEVEPISPQEAAGEATVKSKPVARVVLDPPALVLTVDRTPLMSTEVGILNAGGMTGKYHVCKDTLPGWMSLEGNERGELGPGEKVEISIVVDAAEAEAAAGKELGGGPRTEDLCAVLRVEVDGGGSGTLLPVVCVLGER